MEKFYCTECDMGFHGHTNLCLRCGSQADDFSQHEQPGFVAVNTLQEAIAILRKQLVEWRYFHRPVLYPAYTLPIGKPVDSHHVYFVNDDGDEVAAWSLSLSAIQLFRPPRKVDRNAFPDGPKKVMIGDEIPRFI